MEGSDKIKPSTCSFSARLIHLSGFNIPVFSQFDESISELMAVGCVNKQWTLIRRHRKRHLTGLHGLPLSNKNDSRLIWARPGFQISFCQLHTADKHCVKNEYPSSIKVLPRSHIHGLDAGLATDTIRHHSW